MRKWEFTISARLRGALGVWQRFMPIIEAPTQAEAFLKLYDTYEHISLIRCTEVATTTNTPLARGEQGRP